MPECKLVYSVKSFPLGQRTLVDSGPLLDPVKARWVYVINTLLSDLVIGDPSGVQIIACADISKPKEKWTQNIRFVDEFLSLLWTLLVHITLS